MEIREIKKIIELMKEHELTKFELEEENFRIALARGQGDEVRVMAPVAAAPAAPIPVAAAAVPAQAEAGAAAAAAPAPDEGLVDIKAPIVGTFYRSSSPEAEPYVAVGQQVTKDTVVCIVEAMKVMNEIKADVSGTITEILVDNATSVMFGQALFKVKPN